MAKKKIQRRKRMKAMGFMMIKLPVRVVMIIFDLINIFDLIDGKQMRMEKMVFKKKAVVKRKQELKKVQVELDKKSVKKVAEAKKEITSAATDALKQTNESSDSSFDAKLLSQIKAKK